MSKRIGLGDLDERENGLIRVSLRRYLNHQESSRRRLAARFGDQADLAEKDAQLARLRELIEKLRRGTE